MRKSLLGMHCGGSTQQAPMPWPHISPGATRWLHEAFGTLQSLPTSQAQAVMRHWSGAAT
jgi:hypothetical protein